MTSLVESLESLIAELDGMGGAYHLSDDKLAFYEQFRAACLGLLADHPTMDIETACGIGEAIGCAMFFCFDGASYELQTLVDRLGE